jgi:hypothetical protein
MNPAGASQRGVRIAKWFLVLSYGIGAPLFAWLEYRQGIFSARFQLPPMVLYLVAATQFASAVALSVRQLAPWAAAALSVTTLGAIAGHLRIGSPMTALPALCYTILQIWFGVRVSRADAA